MAAFGSPVPVGSRHTSGYGPRAGGFHAGDDWAPPTPNAAGVPIYAVTDGTVEAFGSRVLAGHTGNGIILDHGKLTGSGSTDRMKTYYGHLADFAPEVRVGAKVKAGQRIGTMGRTGNATGVHLHLTVLCNGKIIGAAAWLKRRGITPGVSKPATLAPPKTASVVVRAGDTLTAIAKRAGITLAKLLGLNPSIRNPNKINPGQKVRTK